MEGHQEIYPHISVNRISIEKPRHRYGGGGSRPERNNVSHGQNIRAKIEELNNEFEDSLSATPKEFNPSLIFVVRLEGAVDIEEFRRSNLTVLSEEAENYVVLFSEDQLARFKDRIALYGTEVPVGRNPRYHWIASITEDLRKWGAGDRLGPRLSAVNIEETEIYKADVDLWVYGDDDGQVARIEELTSFIGGVNGRIIDRFVNRYFNIFRVEVTGKALIALLEVGIIQKIDLPPQPNIVVINEVNIPIDQLDGPKSTPSEDSPRVCVIDSGIVSNHPLFKGAIGYSQSVPSGAGDGVDANGHGTRVCGIALYGDVAEGIARRHFEPEFFIYSAKVTNEDGKFDDDKLIVNQMDEAIRLFYEEHNCRIFNISLGDEALVYDGGKPSAWAYILDVLAKELDVVIVVSSGNQSLIVAARGDEARNYREEYPQYLTRKESRLIEPATAANAITVGSLISSDNSYHQNRLPNDPAYQLVGAIDLPSPFSRSGPGVNDSIKPEVCESGGGFIWSGYHDGFIDDPEQQIVTTAHQFVRRLFDYDKGTSYSAAKVSHLAGRILKQYPGISANLVRALIVSSSRIPGNLLQMVDFETATKIVGYGKPDVKRSLFSSDSRVTLFGQDEIGVDAIHVFEIPMPEVFRSTQGERQVNVSLAFDPPVRNTRRDYLGYKMEFNLFRGLTLEQIEDWFSERPEDFQPESFGSAHSCPMLPRVTARSKGTLQKGIFRFVHNAALTNYAAEKLHLLVRCKTGWADELEFGRQKYAIVVTIEHMAQPIEIYNQVREAVRQLMRQRTRAR